MTNKQAFATTMHVIAATLDRKLPPAAIDGYWLALSGLTEDEFACATKRALSECMKFMPTPAELLAFAGKSRNLTAEAATAWAAVRAAIRLHDYTVASIDFGALVNTALRCMGPWEWLCEQSDDDMVWRQRDFERFYVAFASGPADALRPESLTGWGAGRVGCANVRISIDGKPLPLALPAAPNPVSDLVRELADSKSQAGEAGSACAGSSPAGSLGTGSHRSAAEQYAVPPLRETKPKAPPMTEADVEARKAEIRAQMAARGVTLPEPAEATP